METNQDSQTGDVGRTVGNGVILAYTVTALSMTTLVIVGTMPWGWAAGLIALMFAFVLADDFAIQHLDMHTPGGYQTRREAREGGQEATEQ